MRGLKSRTYARTCSHESRRGSSVTKTGCTAARPRPAAAHASSASVTRAIFTSSDGQMSGQKVKPK